MIKIEGLRKEFGRDVVALDDINLEFEDSTFIALLGPSGCGKTTTLNCVAGLLEPTSGKIFFDDQDVTDLQPKDRNIGMVFQSYALYPHMRVIDNIAFSLKQKKVSKEERHAKAREIAKKLQIEHLLDRRPSELSGGQQQRVSMARALIKNPKVLLLDEPMSNLDARLKIEIRDEIKRLQQDTGITAILVTHDQEEAMAMADKIAILDNGQIQQFDTPEMLYHHPRNLFVAHFMGNPPMNFIDAELVKEKEELYLVSETFRTPLKKELYDKVENQIGKQVVIGVRSHQVDVSLTEKTGYIPMRVQITENLGKEIMISGYVDQSFTRVTIPEKLQGSWENLKNIRKQTDAHIYIGLTSAYNVFDKESGMNLNY